MRRLPCAALVALAAAACNPPAGTQQGGTPQPPTERQLAEQIAAHAFWRAKMTPERVMAMAEQITALGRWDAVGIDDQGRMRITDSVTGAKGQPSIGGRKFSVALSNWPTRPTVAQVLAEMKSALDVREFDERKGQ